MDKPWKELVKLAVLETEIPGQDEEGETIAASPRFRRGRRRGRQQSPIPSPQEIMSMDNETPASARFSLRTNTFTTISGRRKNTTLLKPKMQPLPQSRSSPCMA